MTDFGIEVSDGDGNVTFSTRSLEAHYLGSFKATSRRGSYTPPESSKVDKVWAFSGSVHGVKGRSTVDMGVWVEGKTIYWQKFFSDSNLRIHYGGYSS